MLHFVFSEQIVCGCVEFRRCLPFFYLLKLQGRQQKGPFSFLLHVYTTTKPSLIKSQNRKERDGGGGEVLLKVANNLIDDASA